jgi:hypothetical protein
VPRPTAPASTCWTIPIIAQLCALERRTARGGRDSIDHPPNGHDDLINGIESGSPSPGAVTASATS